MSQAPTKFSKIINEGSTAIYADTLKDEAGVVIPLSAMMTLTLTLSVVDALTLLVPNFARGNIVNSRDAVDALNANNVTFHPTSGLLTYVLQPLDTAMQDPAQEFEIHLATWQATYNSGANAATWDVDFLIRNLSKVGV